ncbi:hypothetical protein DYB32_007249 [Aphanomyces invadans]|uniref:Kinetochore protein Ndc80 CH domain-containing protein n=1 Tax=Aphanomyces invadans TaxID=157072 RepID=A0A3R7A5R7_9STRA|nr:hypothetical protein DYB32_007249 [Aphanomyces invadans]
MKKDFVNIMQFLFRELDPNFEVSAKIEEDFANCFRTLKYPFPISKMALAAHATMAELQRRIDTQELSSDDLERITAERARLQEQLNNTEKRYKNIQSSHWQRETEISQHMDRIEDLVNVYMTFCRRLKLDERKDANGVEYAIQIDAHSGGAKAAAALTQHLKKTIVPSLQAFQRQRTDRLIRILDKGGEAKVRISQATSNMNQAVEAARQIDLQERKLDESIRLEREAMNAAIDQKSGEIVELELELERLKAQDAASGMGKADKLLRDTKIEHDEMTNQYKQEIESRLRFIQHAIALCVAFKEHMAKQMADTEDWLKKGVRAAVNMVAQAAEAVSPNLSLSLYKTPVEEFHHRWTTVSLFLDALAAETLPDIQQRTKLSDSNTRDNLAKLVKLLYAEEDALDRQMYGGGQEECTIDARPCMEYLLEHNVLQNLCAKAAQDSPRGLMVLVLIFLTDLLRESRINYPILPTRGVYRSVCELIQAAMVREVEDGMVQKCLLHCLHALWVKLKGDPVQTEFFFLRIYKPVPGDHSGNLALSPSKISELVLFTGMSSSLKLVPFLNILVVDTCITKEILTQFHTRFLQGPLLEALLDPSEAAARTGIHYACIVLDLLATCGRSPDANPMLHATISFLLHHHHAKTVGSTSIKASLVVPVVTSTNELAPPLLDQHGESVRLLSELLHRTNSLSPSLSVAAIDLFALMLRLNAPQVDAVLLPTTSTSLVSTAQASSLEAAGHRNLAVWFSSRFPHSLLSTLDDTVWQTIIKAHGTPSLALPPSTWDRASPSGIPFASSDWQGYVVSLLSYVIAAEQRVLREKSTALLTSTIDGETSSSDTEEGEDDDEGEVEQSLGDNDAAGPTPTRHRRRRRQLPRWQVRVPSMTTVAMVDAVVAVTPPSSSSAWESLESMVVNRLERWLDNSLEENVALSGLVVLLAERIPDTVFDWGKTIDSPSLVGEKSPSLRAVLEDVHAQAFARIQRLPQTPGTSISSRLTAVKVKLMRQPSDDAPSSKVADLQQPSFDGPELLLVSFVVLEEMLKELVAGLVAVETVQSLPEMPEGVYLEAHQSSRKQKKHELWADEDDVDDDVLKQRRQSSPSKWSEDKVDDMDTLLTSAASQLQSIMAPGSSVVP